MREIKFRAWDGCEMRFMSMEKDGIYKCGSHKYLMQYTGLKDKNDKEIYEGDINKHGFVVSWSGDMGGGLGMNAGWYLQRDDFESWVELESRCNENGDNHEIIGNIHQNKDLLK